MKKTRSYRVSENTHVLIINEAKTKRRSIGETLDIIIEGYFNTKPKEAKPKQLKPKEQEIDFLDGFSNAFRVAWIDWIEFKKSIKSEYKTIKTQAIAVANLAKQCQGVEKRMIDAIYHSIGNNYKGIYEPKNNNKQNGTLTEQFVQKIKGAY